MGHKLYGKEYELNFTLLVGNPQVTINQTGKQKNKINKIKSKVTRQEITRIYLLIILYGWA